MNTSMTANLPPAPLKRTPGLGVFLILLIVGMTALAVLTSIPSQDLLERAKPYFTAEQIDKGLQYSAQRRLLMWGQIILHWSLLLGLVGGGWGRRLADFYDRRTGRRWLLTLLLVGGTVYVLEELLALPLRLVALENARAWGMTSRSVGDWFEEYAKSFLFGTVLYGFLLVALFVVMWLLPRWWWPIAALASGLLAIVFAWVLPVVVSPLYNKFTPLEDPYLLRRFEVVAEKAGVSVREVLVMDASRRGKHTNAYFTGFGDTQRIVVYDNLLKPFYQPEDATDVASVVGLVGTPQGTALFQAAANRQEQRVQKAAEIESILAHEVGHWYHGHILKGIALAVLGSFFGFFLLNRILCWAVRRRPFLLHSPTDPAAIPLVMLVVLLGSWAVSPVEYAVSRHFEREADQVALDLAQKPEAFIEAEKRLVRDNLLNVAPSPVSVWFFSSHPPAVERIEMGVAWQKAHGKVTLP